MGLEIAIAAALAAAPTPAAPPPLDAYGKLPAVEAIEISPDGKRLAFIATNGEARFLAVSELETNRVLVRIPTGNRKVLYVQWVGSNNVIGTVESDADAGWWVGGKTAQLFAADIDIDKQRSHPLIDVHRAPSGGIALNAIYGKPQIRVVSGKPYAFAQGEYLVYHTPYLSLFKYDTATAVSGLDRQGDAETSDWLVGDDGQALAQEIYNGETQRWGIRTRMNGGFATAIEGKGGLETPSIMGLSRDGSSTLVAVRVDDDKEGRRTELVELKPGQTAWSEPVLRHLPDQLVFDPATEHFIGTGDLDGDAWDYVFVDAADQMRWKVATKAFAGSAVHVRSMTADHQKWVVSVDSPTEGQAYALVDFASGKTQWIGNDYDSPNTYLSEKKSIAFKAADGLDLTGYLTIPKGADAKNLPLVVFPHGGPQARDEPGFDWWAQAMASRGYAVLQVNFRGSDGFGWRHLSAGFGEWGRKMQTDLSDGVRYLAKEGDRRSEAGVHRRRQLRRLCRPRRRHARHRRLSVRGQRGGHLRPAAARALQRGSRRQGVKGVSAPVPRGEGAGRTGARRHLAAPSRGQGDDPGPAHPRQGRQRGRLLAERADVRGAQAAGQGRRARLPDA